MKRPRLEMALSNLSSGDWERFENFASEFMAVEYDNLRTVAAPSGDEGRDAELFSPTDDSTVVFQFSVAQNWQAKIDATAKRLQSTIPAASILIYVTNQGIGATGDKIKAEIRKNYSVHLDIRDKFYFLERFIGDSRREAIAESLAEDIVDPILSSSGVITRHATELNSEESKAAFIYLGLQWKDDVREKGLTKLAFEAVVRSVLRNTDSEHRMHRAMIKQRIRELLTNHPNEMVDNYTDSALLRLTKKSIRHWSKEDEFCLTFEETNILKDYLTELEVSDNALLSEIDCFTTDILAQRKITSLEPCKLTARVRRVLESFLFSRSEAFASALHSGELKYLTYEDIVDIINKDISAFPEHRKINNVLPDIVFTAVRKVLLSTSLTIQNYLRSLADSYTLLSYLKETPDIQSAVEKMFSHGEIWLDTNIVLPLIAENLLDEEESRFQRMVSAALETGIQLKVTPGVIEEVERHMNRCLTYLRTPSGKWEGFLPYLLTEYLETGKSLGSFPTWLENFRGDVRPEDDLAEFLRIKWNIKLQSLETESNTAPNELQYALKEILRGTHNRRQKAKNSQADEISILRLVSHDVESYAGVLQKRTKEETSAFGYSAWWLTLDRTVFGIENTLRTQYGYKIPSTPVLSADFLINYLAFGPNRKRVSKNKESNLPVIIDAGLIRYLTPELIDEAEKLREEMKFLPDHVVRRRIRDNLDAAKRRLGRIAKSGQIKEENI